MAELDIYIPSHSIFIESYPWPGFAPLENWVAPPGPAKSSESRFNMAGMHSLLVPGCGTTSASRLRGLEPQCRASRTLPNTRPRNQMLQNASPDMSPAGTVGQAGAAVGWPDWYKRRQIGVSLHFPAVLAVGASLSRRWSARAA